MKAKFLNTLAAGALLAMAGVATAGEPIALDDSQMDAVSAGGLAVATSLAQAAGLLQAATATQTASLVQVVQIVPTQGGQLTLIQSTSAAAAASSSL